mmetsp:Transcript_29027/g.56845  ORF Transcript_29027/g.56845 Transcript_29027/m.56845 type:complete len:135 (-) Transcript_29027:445-849(-)
MHPRLQQLQLSPGHRPFAFVLKTYQHWKFQLMCDKQRAKSPTTRYQFQNLYCRGENKHFHMSCSPNCPQTAAAPQLKRIWLFKSSQKDPNTRKRPAELPKHPASIIAARQNSPKVFGSVDGAAMWLCKTDSGVR